MKFSFKTLLKKINNKAPENNETDILGAHIETNNSIYGADGKPLTEDAKRLIEIESAQLFAEEQRSLNPKFHRTEHEEELTDNFFMKYHEQFRPMESEMIDTIQRAKNFKSSVDGQIELCRKAINMFYDLKKFCSRSKGGKLYFSDSWEHCHNSKKADFSFIEETETLLKDLQSNYEDYNEYYTKLKTLDKDLLGFISDNSPILQRDIYKYFHVRMKSDIQKYIREFEKSNLITREKKGSSYILNIVPLAETH